MHRLRFLSVKVKPFRIVFTPCTVGKISTAKTQISSAQIGGKLAREIHLI